MGTKDMTVWTCDKRDCGLKEQRPSGSDVPKGWRTLATDGRAVVLCPEHFKEWIQFFVPDPDPTPMPREPPFASPFEGSS